MSFNGNYKLVKIFRREEGRRHAEIEIITDDYQIIRLSEQDVAYLMKNYRRFRSNHGQWSKHMSATISAPLEMR